MTSQPGYRCDPASCRLEVREAPGSEDTTAGRGAAGVPYWIAEGCRTGHGDGEAGGCAGVEGLARRSDADVRVASAHAVDGAGGSGIGLAGAGFALNPAANHRDRANETHSANIRDAEHLCADVNNYDLRRLPTTDILWASPICT